MKRHEQVTGLNRPGLSRLAAVLLLLAPGLVFSGCVVGNDEFEGAKRESDRYREESNATVTGNDQLNKEIAKLYNDCDSLSSQLAMVSSVSMHNRLTADIGKPKPVPQPTRPSPTATTRPRSSGDGGGSAAGNRSGGSGRTGGSSSGSGGTGRSGSGSGSTSGGGGSPTPASGGSLDWGSISF